MGDVRVSQKTKLTFKLADGSQKELDCSVKKIYNDRMSLIFPEEALDYLDYLKEGKEINVKIFSPGGVKIFDSIILDSPLEADFIIEFIENYVEIQRRKYLRADLNTKIIIQREEDNVITNTLDIGGGGVCFFYEGKFGYKEKVSCMLYLPMILNSIKAKGFIIKDSNLKENEHVLFFTDIDDKERDKIIQKCFEIESNNYFKK